jgi:GTP-binding protein
MTHGASGTKALFARGNMFIDEAEIEAQGGRGGDGCYAYERLKYKPNGPPAGGNGGRGGHVYVEGNSQLHTLQDISFRHTYRAHRGAHGQGSFKHGKNGADITIEVPLGTIVREKESGAILCDILDHRQRVIVAGGGRGGRGNASLVTPKNPQPSSAEKGKCGECKRLQLEIKVLADIGLVGRPNSGKSTFLSKISRAHPKIADYPFTTTHPNLGIVKQQGGYSSFVVADIPGLMEGSYTGRGLGIRFLRHIERTKALAIMVESTSPAPADDAGVLLDELNRYSPQLAEKPRCYILTKNDLVEKPEVPDGWFSISSVTGNGIPEVLALLARMCRLSG